MAIMKLGFITVNIDPTKSFKTAPTASKTPTKITSEIDNPAFFSLTTTLFSIKKPPQNILLVEVEILILINNTSWYIPPLYDNNFL